MESRGLRRWLLCGSIAGDDPARPFAGGILWMNWQRRGDFQDLVRQVGDQTSPLRMIDAFFQTPWLGFDAFVVDPKRSPMPIDDAEPAPFARDQQRTVCDFMANQIEDRLRAEPSEPQPFRIWVDARQCGYENRRAAIEDVQQHVLRSVFGRLRPGDMVTDHRVETTPALNLGHVLLQAVLGAWQGGAHATRPAQERIAGHLGWKDLRAVSRPDDTKFNVQIGRPSQRISLPAQLGLFDQPRSTRRRAPTS